MVEIGVPNLSPFVGITVFQCKNGCGNFSTFIAFQQLLFPRHASLGAGSFHCLTEFGVRFKPTVDRSLMGSDLASECGKRKPSSHTLFPLSAVFRPIIFWPSALVIRVFLMSEWSLSREWCHWLLIT